MSDLTAQGAINTVGHVSTGGSVNTYWPNSWTWPTYSYPVYINGHDEEYANKVHVLRGAHDATLRFYRTRGESETLIKTVTVPLGVLDWLEGKS